MTMISLLRGQEPRVNEGGQSGFFEDIMREKKAAAETM